MSLLLYILEIPYEISQTHTPLLYLSNIVTHITNELDYPTPITIPRSEPHKKFAALFT